MLKLRILDLKNFLKTVNKCDGPVFFIHSDGHREDLCENNVLQHILQSQYENNRKILLLMLYIPIAKDYLSIVNYSIGDC